MLPAPALLQAGLNAVTDPTYPLDHRVQICRREDSTWGSEVQNTLVEATASGLPGTPDTLRAQRKGQRVGAAAWRGGPEAGPRQWGGTGPGPSATHLSAADCTSKFSQ